MIKILCCLISLIVFNVVLGKNEDSITKYLGTKSPYHFKEFQAETPKGCEAVHIAQVTRHGTRNPTKGALKKLTTFIETSIPKFSSYLNEEYNWIKESKMSYDHDYSGQLTDGGEIELYEMGKRLKKNFPQFFPKNIKYNPKYCSIQTTAVTRTSVSANSFALGLFENSGSSKLQVRPWATFSESKSIDNKLRFFTTCNKYVNEVKNNETADDEAEAYWDLNLPQIQELMGKKIGIFPKYNLTKFELQQMYALCQYEYTIEGKKNGWCSIFDSKSFDFFEFVGDLEEFYLKSYGFEINYKISAPLLQDFIQNFEQFIDGSKLKLNLKFAHAETIIPLVTLLGLFEDEKMLHAKNSQNEIETRKWRASEISPYASNMRFTFYNCTTNNENTYKIKVSHNEHDYKLNDCENYFCDFEKFKEIFENSLNYNFSKECENDLVQELSYYQTFIENPQYSLIGFLILGRLLSRLFVKPHSE